LDYDATADGNKQFPYQKAYTSSCIFPTVLIVLTSMVFFLAVALALIWMSFFLAASTFGAMVRSLVERALVCHNYQWHQYGQIEHHQHCIGDCASFLHACHGSNIFKDFGFHG